MTPTEFKKEFFPGIDEHTLLWRLQFVFEPCIPLPQESQESRREEIYSKLLRKIDQKYIVFKDASHLEIDDTGCKGAIIRGKMEETALQLKMLQFHLKINTVAVWGKDTMETAPVDRHKYQNWLRGLVADAECITFNEKGLATNVTEVIFMPLMLLLNARTSQEHALEAYHASSRQQKLPWGHGKNKAYNQKIFFKVELPDGSLSQPFPSYTSWEDISEQPTKAKKLGRDRVIEDAPENVQKIFMRQLEAFASHHGKTPEEYVHHNLDGVVYHFGLGFMGGHSVDHVDEDDADGPAKYIHNTNLKG